jgi:uncharacterized protein YukE
VATAKSAKKNKARSRAQVRPSAPAVATKVVPHEQSRSKKMSDPKKPASDAGADRNVDQIRDILFGGQMRDYERRFQELGQRLEAEMTRMRDSQEKRHAQLEKRLDEQFEKLSKQVRQEVTDRTQAVDDLETRIQQSARTARSEINSALDAQAHELTRTDERLREAIAELASLLNERADEASASLARASNDLRAEKVGREDLSALFTELSLRLKGDFDLPSI